MRIEAETPDYSERSIEPCPKDQGNKTQNNQVVDEDSDFFNRTVMVLNLVLLKLL